MSTVAPQRCGGRWSIASLMVHTRLLASREPPSSCLTCLAWGLLPGWYRSACYSFAHNRATGVCVGCDRTVALKKGYRRLCWCQASLQAKGEVSVLGPYLARVRDHQLFFAGMHKPRQPGPRLGKHRRRPARPRPTPTIPRPPITGCPQPRLFDMPRDFTRFDHRQHAGLDNPWLIWAQHTARLLSQTRGWTRWVASDLNRALVIPLANHLQGKTIRYSELFPALRARKLSVEHTVEILDQLNLLDDDRGPAFELWPRRKLTDLAPGIRRDPETWLRLLREGGPRNRPHDLNTLWASLNEIRPIPLDWPTRHDHLREITREDILTSTNSPHGSKRHHTLSVPRSLFRHRKKTATLFGDPPARIRLGRHDYTVVQPLQPTDVRAALAAAITPSAHLALALAAIHVARPQATHELLLDDADLGNHRLVIAGHTRPLDEFTHRMILT